MSKKEAAHEKARQATVKKFGPDWVGEEAHTFYTKVLASALKPKKKAAKKK